VIVSLNRVSLSCKPGCHNWKVSLVGVGSCVLRRLPSSPSEVVQFSALQQRYQRLVPIVIAVHLSSSAGLDISVETDYNRASGWRKGHSLHCHTVSIASSKHSSADQAAGRTARLAGAAVALAVSEATAAPEANAIATASCCSVTVSSETIMSSVDT
jgi:hypothetical protein